MDGLMDTASPYAFSLWKNYIRKGLRNTEIVLGCCHSKARIVYLCFSFVFILLKILFECYGIICFILLDVWLLFSYQRRIFCLLKCIKHNLCNAECLHLINKDHVYIYSESYRATWSLMLFLFLRIRHCMHSETYASIIKLFTW